MKQNSSDRFIRVFNQPKLSGSTEIWVDRETGVNYLWHSGGYSGGLTPLLDKNGQVVTTDVSLYSEY